jgi:hypothetical protein
MMYLNCSRLKNYNMKARLLYLLTLLIFAGTLQAQDLHTFSNADGKTLEDRILKYDFEEKMVTLDKNGKVPLDTFSKADQDYILNWNMAMGFKSTMRFKTEIKKGSWARMKSEKTITPYWMDAIQVAGKQTPTHLVIMLDDYEEYNAIYMEAEGYSITLKNQNFFPIENIVVESKIYFEQETFVLPDDLLQSMENEYTDTVTTNKVKFKSETIPVIIPREEMSLFSAASIIVDQQVDRNSLVTESEEEGDDDSGDDEDEEEEEEEVEIVVEGMGDMDDHGRRRKGDLTGVWVRIGIKGPDGEMIWRELTDPTSLPKKVVWE